MISIRSIICNYKDHEVEQKVIHSKKEAKQRS